MSGYAEGWAPYAECLMDELGYLDDPADRLGMLDQQAYRAARVIVGIGMHLELRIPTTRSPSTLTSVGPLLWARSSSASTAG